MPDTGAPWNIPYVAGTDLVADWPTDSQTLAEAVASGLSDASRVKQFVSGSQATPVTITATSYTTTNLSASITPSSASNDIYVFVITNLFQKRDADSSVYTRITRDATQLVEYQSRLDGATSTNNQILTHPLNLLYIDSPATTSSVTYAVDGKLEYGFNNHQSKFHENGPGLILLMEVA